ncbi:thioester reductase domain-containing protein [Streptomyces olivochromogenes]|uniref:thioester reductase domain-containing protein n=1 Tax=Streptomyces olivochromogenes TaxID=1963 RepID=UPI001F2E4CFB|nr:thioester reductase domain-containing protein [Streptomyces olivochromogenes]MCF3132403.1 thioester reductase domain-containing protein [Streptomyces olivochromogenes]
MRDLNDDAVRRSTAESIERGGGALSVTDLLAKVAVGAVAEPAAAARTWDVDALAATIADAAGRYLPTGTLAPDADFFDAGGTSVHAVELVAELEGELGIEVDLDDVFADARPISLARRWLPEMTGTATTAASAGPPASGERGAATAIVTSPNVTAIAGTSVFGATPTGTAPATTTAPPAPLPLSAAGTRPAAAPGTLPVPAPRTPPAVFGDARPAAAPHTRARQEDLDQILADLALADRLPFVDVPQPLPPRRILLTGATGFLGSHMLLDLLRHSDAHVYCLVRAADEEAATERLGQQLRSYRLPWSSEVRRRVTVLPGDIRRPRLGLDDELWHTLAHELDSIVGVAAAVDFLRGYQSLRGSNVLGALTLAELAATGRPKPLHHISSIAVFNEVGITSMGEDDPLAHIDRLISGYDQSKWTAEVALRRARDHGLVVTALRPGGIGGHTKTGAYNPQDLSSGLISAFGRFRTVPAFRYLNAAPVDWVSRVAVAAICEPDAWGFDYNLTGVPNRLVDVVSDMSRGGMHVRVQDWDDWRTDTLARLEAEPVPELTFLNRVLQSPTALKLCEATLQGPAAVAERTDALVAALGLSPAARYDAEAQLKTFEKLADDGLARLPQKDDQPYLWFAETTEGTVGPVGAAAETPCSMALTLSIAGMYQLVKERRVDVTGEVTCAAIHPLPLTVERGDVWVRPEEGIPQQHGLRHQLLRYRLRLRDADGGQWWLEGRKYARARRDLWRQTRALTVEIGREGEAASLLGEVVVPADSYVRDQIDGIKVDPRLTGQEKRAAKLTWLAWFGLEMGRGLVGPFARVAADLLDLRRTPTLTEQHR